MDYKNLILTIKDCSAHLTINRPTFYNALNVETLNEIDDVINVINNNDNIKVLLITGAGKAFIAGADIKEMANMTEKEAYEYSQFGANIFYKLETMKKITIALINGYALGGGLELALACDLRFASFQAKFGQPEVGLGVTPGFSGCVRLPRIVGITKAKELLYTARTIDSDEAYNIGLINQVFAAETLLDDVEEIIKKICHNSFSAIINVKETVASSLDVSLKDGMIKEAEFFSKCFTHPDQKEGMNAFLEKRIPNYNGGKK